MLVFLWWIPVSLAAPVIAEAFGLPGQPVLVWRIVVQTILGLAGVLVVGKRILRIMTSVPVRRMLPTVWHVPRHGTVEAGHPRPRERFGPCMGRRVGEPRTRG